MFGENFRFFRDNLVLKKLRGNNDNNRSWRNRFYFFDIFPRFFLTIEKMDFFKVLN